MPSIQPLARDIYSTMRDLHWSPKEKDIARRAFDDALHRELEATIREAKQMAEKIKEASELWELEQHLTKRRKEIDAKYEYSCCSWCWLVSFEKAVSAWISWTA